MNWIEIAGFITGVLGVWLTIKQNIWCWPVGLANVILYLIFFLEDKLYADMCLQAFYIAAQVYGWYQWGKGTSVTEELKVTYSSFKIILLSIIITVIGTYGFGYYFSHYTDAALPYWDSALSSASIIGTWMVAKKKIENWIIWIVADAIYIQIYIIKDAYLTAGLYFLFLLLAIEGYYEWKQSWLKTRFIK